MARAAREKQGHGGGPSSAASKAIIARRQCSRTRDQDLPVSKDEEYPEYLWREVPKGQPGVAGAGESGSFSSVANLR